MSPEVFILLSLLVLMVRPLISSVREEIWLSRHRRFHRERQREYLISDVEVEIALCEFEERHPRRQRGCRGWLRR